MKLISLNTWGGIMYEPLVEFIKIHSTDTDIFCFQEVFHNATKTRPLLGDKIQKKLFSDIQNILQDFNGYYAPSREGDVAGLAIFIKKSFTINKIDHIVIFEQLNKTSDENDEGYFSMGRDLQRIEFINSGKIYTILNFHGMWIAKGKIDTEKRIEQSEKVRKIFDESKGARILCTDLNVGPNTKSLSILKNGNRSLVEEYGITSTRSSLKNRTEIIDYVITSPEVKVEDFKMLKDEVSDHLPMFLEFN